jgi:hypothetical protein
VLQMLGSIFDELPKWASTPAPAESCSCRPASLQGSGAWIQVITVDGAGLVTQLRDFVRPLSALSAAATEVYESGQSGGLGRRTTSCRR